jgi:hypothetical protein
LRTLIFWFSADRVMVDGISTRFVSADAPNGLPRTNDLAA